MVPHIVFEEIGVPYQRTRPQLGSYLQRMLARPAVLRVLAAEELAPPFV